MKTLQLPLLAICLLASTLLFSQSNIEQSTSIRADGNAPDASAMLDVQSTTQGMLVPRLSTAERGAIVSPATGLLVFDTDENSFYYYDGNRWFPLGLPTDGELDEILKSDILGDASWQTLIDSSAFPDPDPMLSGSLPIGDPMFGAQLTAVTVQGNYAYVLDNEFPEPDLSIVDVSNPSAPVQTGSFGFATGSNIISVEVKDNLAYVVNAGSDLQIIDISNPAAPVAVGSFPVGSSAKSVAVQGNYAYIVEAGGTDQLMIIDVSNPASPTLNGNLATGNPTAVEVQGNYAYVVGLASDDLKVIDVSNPAAPALSGSLVIGDFALALAIQGNYVYVVDASTDDIKVIDVSNPAAPMLSGSLSVGGVPLTVAAQGHYAFVADNNSDDLKVIDVSDPTSPVLSNSIALGTLPIQLAVQGNYAYIVDNGTDDLKIVKLSTPSAVGVTLTGDLGTYIDPDADPANELNFSGALNGNNLEITDAGGITSVDLSGLKITTVADLDTDTKIQVEESPNEDIIRFDVAGSEAMQIGASGKVGIGTATPDIRLQVESGTDITPVSGGFIQAGASNGINLAIDNNEIMVRNNSATYPLILNHDGGDVLINGTNAVGSVGIGTASPDARLHIEDGALLAQGTTGGTPVSGAGTRMMWIPEKKAFRVGEVFGTQWDDSNIGSWSASVGGFDNLVSEVASFTGGRSGNSISNTYSFIGGGYGNTISGSSSFIAGGNTNTVTNSGNSSFIGGGHNSTASGQYSFIGGGGSLLAKSGGEAVFGYYNTDYTPISTTGFDPADRLFVIGNGTNNANRSNAVTVMKNGKVGIGTANPTDGTLTVAGSVAASTLGSYKGATNNRTVTMWGGSGNQWLRFRNGGSPSGVAGLVFSNFSQLNHFIYNDGTYLNFKYEGSLDNEPDNLLGTAVSRMKIRNSDGSVTIGNVNPAIGYILSVDGKIACEEVLVDLSGDWPDYVFQEDYELKSLAEVRAHIDEKGHLPGVPSAQEVEENGVVLGEMNKVLMEKVEELTLYILQQEERIKALERAVEK